uniref:p12-2p n=1 Tax=Pyrococcus sp. 12/1 TaxID=758582 RepID=D6MY08_9EURY|nr:RNA chaperone Hfq [Pyrococcus sp. 12/1]ADF80209.1 p12-2p [Pyrococcus sp. 12/1]
MVEPVFDAKEGVWKCPICGFIAMSKKVVEAHISREHPSQASSNGSQDKSKVAVEPGVNEQKHGKNEKGKNKAKKGKEGKKRQKKAEKWKRYKVGDTWVNVLERDEITIRDSRGWQFFLTANYVATLHKKKVRIRLSDGTELEGVMKAKDPYFISLKTDEGRILINKAYIMWIKPLEEG